MPKPPGLQDFLLMWFNCSGMCVCMCVFAYMCRSESMYLCVEISQLFCVCVLKMNNYSSSLNVFFGKCDCSFVA